jgi:hypothetical protein
LRYLVLPLSVWRVWCVDCQHHEDKTTAKIPTWNGRFINLTSHTTLVKLVLSSQAIYQLTMLLVPPGVTDNMEKKSRDQFFGWPSTKPHRCTCT